MAKYCVRCGSLLEEGARFCETCGEPVVSNVSQLPTPLQTDAPPPAVPPPPPVLPQSERQAPSYPSPQSYPASILQPSPAKSRPTGFIILGVLLAGVICCGVVILGAAWMGGPNLLGRLPGFMQNMAQSAMMKNTPTTTAASASPLPPALPTANMPQVTPQLPTAFAPEVTPQLPAPVGQPEEFSDDFYTTANQWPVTDAGLNQKGYLNGLFFIRTTKESGEGMSFIPKMDYAQEQVKDFEIEFDGLQFSNDGYLGLNFRVVDDNDYYQAAIMNGAFIIRKYVDGKEIDLTHGSWVESNSIYQSGPNHIKVVCHGDVIQLLVNNGLMAQLKDDSFPAGDVLLVVGLPPNVPDGAQAEARFANFHALWWK